MGNHLLSYHTFEEDGVVLFLSIDLVTPLKVLAFVAHIRGIALFLSTLLIVFLQVLADTTCI